MSEVKLRGSEFMYSPEVIKYEKDKIKSILREETADMSMIIIDEKPIKEIGDILFYTMGLQGKREGLIQIGYQDQTGERFSLIRENTEVLVGMQSDCYLKYLKKMNYKDTSYYVFQPFAYSLVDYL